MTSPTPDSPPDVATFVLWLDASDGSIATCDGIRWPDGTATVHHRHFPGITSTHPSPEAAAWAAHGKHARIVWSSSTAPDARRSCCEERFGHAPNCPIDQAGAACDPACLHGHTYEPPCALADPPGTCTWPDCLSDGQQAELAEQVRLSMLGEPTTPMPDQRQTCGCRDTASDGPAVSSDNIELTAEEARELVDELSTDLYRAQDALAFVGECCDILDREGRQPTTAVVREWLKGARCGRQLAADHAASSGTPDDQLRNTGRTTVTITIHAPNQDNADRWAGHVSDLVQAEFGQTMRLEITTALDTPAPHPPVYDAVRDGHHDLDGEQS